MLSQFDNRFTSKLQQHLIVWLFGRVLRAQHDAKVDYRSGGLPCMSKWFRCGMHNLHELRSDLNSDTRLPVLQIATVWGHLLKGCQSSVATSV